MLCQTYLKDFPVFNWGFNVIQLFFVLASSSVCLETPECQRQNNHHILTRQCEDKSVCEETSAFELEMKT